MLLNKGSPTDAIVCSSSVVLPVLRILVDEARDEDGVKAKHLTELGCGDKKDGDLAALFTALFTALLLRSVSAFFGEAKRFPIFATGGFDGLP